MRFSTLGLIATLALTLAAPLAVWAQQAGKVWRIAHLTLQYGPVPHYQAFETEMKQLGYIEGQNLIIERRFLGQRRDRIDEVLGEIVALNPDVIVTHAAPLTAAAKRATSTIPIVFVVVRAPVERGLVASLAHPGGNVTGIATFPVATIEPKLFQLAKELIQHIYRVAVLRSADDPPEAIEAQERTARSLHLKIAPIPFRNDRDVARLPIAIDEFKPQVLIAPDSSLLFTRRKEVVHSVAEKRLPTVYAFREAVEDGGLIAVSTDFEEMGRRAATYVDRILRGAKPANLPVEQPTTLKTSVNLKTAKALGLTIPASVLLRADEVIQ